jgi:hypothetical protein
MLNGGITDAFERISARLPRRFLRPVAWQDAPAEVLPEELTDGYRAIPRRVDARLRCA